jgi:predicted branched-subunit amino acid permease
MTIAKGSTPIATMPDPTPGPLFTTRQSVLAGCRDALPVILGYIPFGLALGAALTSAGIDPFTAWCSSWLLLAGAAQIAAVQLLGAGADAIVVIATGLIINARHLLYSAGLARHTAHGPTRWRCIAPSFLPDPAYALADKRFNRPDNGGGSHARLTYFITIGVVFWTSWQLLTGVGALLAGALPTALPLHLAAPLTFLCLLAPMLTNKAGYLAACTAGVVALLCSGLPAGLGLLAGAAAGMIAGATIGARNA